MSEPELCEEISVQGLACTRELGHVGKHRAEGIEEVGPDRWDPSKVEVLEEWD